MTTRKPQRAVSRIDSLVKTNSFVLKGRVVKSKSGKPGRPSVMNQEVVIKLEHAFAHDCSVEEACLYAGISRNTYYEFLKHYPDFQDRIHDLRQAGVLVARKTILAAIEHDANIAFKYLERKRKDEFSSRTEIKHEGVSDRHSVDPEMVALIKRAMGNFSRKVRTPNEALN